jgi:hypothetical protein
MERLHIQIRGDRPGETGPKTKPIPVVVAAASIAGPREESVGDVSVEARVGEGAPTKANSSSVRRIA